MQLGMALRHPPCLCVASKRPFWNVNWKHRLQPLAPLPAVCQPPPSINSGAMGRQPPYTHIHTPGPLPTSCPSASKKPQSW